MKFKELINPLGGVPFKKETGIIRGPPFEPFEINFLAKFSKSHFIYFFTHQIGIRITAGGSNDNQ